MTEHIPAPDQTTPRTMVSALTVLDSERADHAKTLQRVEELKYQLADTMDLNHQLAQSLEKATKDSIAWRTELEDYRDRADDLDEQLQRALARIEELEELEAQR